MSHDLEALFGDIIAIVAADVAALKLASTSRLMAPDEALTLKRYADLLLEHIRENRKVAESEVEDMSHEELMDKVRKLAGGGL